MGAMLYVDRHVVAFMYANATRIHHRSLGAFHMNRFLSAASALAVIAAASQASAADLAARSAPVYTKAPEYVTVSNWSGWYIGGNVGYGWGNDSADMAPAPGRTANSGGSTDVVVGTTQSRPSGGFGGAQIGYNWQAGSFVGGLETDFQGSAVRGSASQIPTFRTVPLNNQLLTSNQSLTWFGTVRGRLGVAVAPNVLFYGTGGLAYGHVDNSLNFESDGVSFPASASGTRTGWTAGGGVEWKFTRNWSGKIEYLHFDFGNVSSDGLVVENTTWHNQFDTVRIGVNYHFN
jgi:outer membrane immunogenic protein